MNNRFRKIWAGIVGAAVGSGLLLGLLLFVVMKDSASSSQSVQAGADPSATQSASAQQTGRSGQEQEDLSDGEQTGQEDGGSSQETAAPAPETAAPTPETSAAAAVTAQTETEAISVQQPEVTPVQPPQSAQPAGDSTFYKDGTVVATGAYIMAEASQRYLTEADVSRLTLKGICYLKNELYAKHGRKFSTPALQNYFSAQPWYEGRYEPLVDDVTVVSLMNVYEEENISFLDAAEARQGYYTFP